MEASTRERLRDRLLDLFDNPVLRLELRHVGAHLRRPWRLFAGWRFHADPSRRVAAYLVWAPFTALAPYLFAAFLQYMERVLGGASGRAAPFPAGFGALIVYGYAFLGCTGPLNCAAFSFTRERDQGVMESLLTSRLTAAEIVLGKVGAVVLPACAAGAVIFLVWLLFPPFTRESHVFFVRFDQPPRLLLLCFWLDLVTTSVAGAFLGVAVAAWCRSARAASAVAMLATLSLCLVPLPAFMVWMPGWMLSQQTAVLPASLHPAVWGLSAAVSLVGFVIAQVRLNTVPMPVTLIPGGSTRVRLSPGAVSAFLLLAVALALGGAGVYGYRAVQVEVASMNALSSSGPVERAYALMRQGQHAQALPLLDAEIGRGVSGPVGTMLVEAKAQCHQELGQYAKAIAAYDDLGRMSKVPEHTATALRGKGECLRAMGKRADAAGMFRRAIQAAQPGSRGGGGLLGPMLGTSDRDVLLAAAGLASLGHRDEALKAYESLVTSADRNVARSAREAVADIREGLADAPRLGVGLSRGMPVVIDTVEPGSGAADAGILAGDRLVAVDGKRIDGWRAIRRALAPHKPGDAVPVVVERAGQRLTFCVRLSPAR